MIRSKFNTESISVKIGIIFAKLGLSPNQWTVLSLVPALLGFLSLYYKNLILGVVLFLISGFIDMIDGAVARVTGQVSNLGAFLDGIIDRYVEFLLYLGILIYNPIEVFIQTYYWIILLMFGAFMPTYIRAYADHRGVITEPEDQKRMGGVLERFERISLILIGMLLGVYKPIYLTYMIIIVAILSNFTALQRMWFVIRFKRFKAPQH